MQLIHPHQLNELVENWPALSPERRRFIAEHLCSLGAEDYPRVLGLYARDPEEHEFAQACFGLNALATL